MGSGDNTNNSNNNNNPRQNETSRNQNSTEHLHIGNLHTGSICQFDQQKQVLKHIVYGFSLHEDKSNNETEWKIIDILEDGYAYQLGIEENSTLDKIKTDDIYMWFSGPYKNKWCEVPPKKEAVTENPSSPSQQPQTKKFMSIDFPKDIQGIFVKNKEMHLRIIPPNKKTKVWKSLHPDIGLKCYKESRQNINESYEKLLKELRDFCKAQREKQWMAAKHYQKLAGWFTKPTIVVTAISGLLSFYAGSTHFQTYESELNIVVGSLASAAALLQSFLSASGYKERMTAHQNAAESYQQITTKLFFEILRIRQDKLQTVDTARNDEFISRVKEQIEQTNERCKVVIPDFIEDTFNEKRLTNRAQTLLNDLKESVLKKRADAIMEIPSEMLRDFGTTEMMRYLEDQLDAPVRRTIFNRIFTKNYLSRRRARHINAVRQTINKDMSALGFNREIERRIQEHNEDMYDGASGIFSDFSNHTLGVPQPLPMGNNNNNNNNNGDIENNFSPSTTEPTELDVVIERGEFSD
jgi:hypothetical protein